MKIKIFTLSNVVMFFSLFIFSTSLNAAITSQPQSVTKCQATTATVVFSISTDYFIPSYQWQVYSAREKIWVNLEDQILSTSGPGISGSATTQMSISFGKPYPLSSGLNGFTVRCVITYSKGLMATSASAVLTVVSPPSFSEHPVSIEKIVDQSASFSVITNPTTGLTYQWQFDNGAGFQNIANATSSTYNIKYVSISDAGNYRCVISNGYCSSVYSNAATLTVYSILAIEKHPAKQAACEGTTATFNIIAANAIGYQWEMLPYKSTIWEAIEGATSSSYTTGVLPSGMNGYQFRCNVYGGVGQVLTSYSAALTVYKNISIYTQPVSVTKEFNESVTFYVAATGTVSTYQWQKNNVNIPGANSSSYTINQLLVSDAGNYKCILTGCNSVTSSTAVLNVNMPAYPNGWYHQNSGSGLNINSVAAISETKAWAVATDPNKLLKTTDGGTTWTSVYTDIDYGYWQSIFFLNESTGMVGGYNYISRTTDGGSTWTTKNLYNDLGVTGYIYGIHFRDASNGWAVGQNGTILKTTDGGATWTKRSYKTDASPVTDINLRTVFFYDANNGIIAGQNGKLYRTTDGGTNWTLATISGFSSEITEVTMLSATRAFFVAPDGQGSIFQTSNGTTWSRITLSGSNYLYSINFSDANNGWAAGGYYSGSWLGKIYRTNDGGLTWVSQKNDNSALLYKVRMFSADHGWAVGEGGEIRRTGKGGCVTPSVNLYEDRSLCANQSYILVADTFVNNYNLKYLWSTGATTGKITVNSTAAYSVTVTNECGVTANDNINMTFLALPAINAGDDIAICNGESAQLQATGGSTYSWNNAGYLSDSHIPNPVATPAATTLFTVTGTDANGCVNSDAVNVTVNSIPTSAFTAPDYVCDGSNATLTYSGVATGKTFNWELSGGNLVSGSNAGPLQVNWSELGDKMISLTTSQNNCTSLQTIKIINVREKPASTFTIPEAVCGSSSAVLNYTGSAPVDATYNWNLSGGTITSGSGQGPLQVSWASGGEKSVTLSVTQNNCTSDLTSGNVEVAYPFNGEQICLVTIDLETGKNMVVWEKTHDKGTASYNIYREGTVVNNYDLIGNVPFDDLSVFVDLNSNPEQQQYKYKISAVDTCGNESSKSPWHKTMFLQYVSSVNGVNLNWQEYQTEGSVVSFNSYVIFRGSDSTSLTQLATISSSFQAFTDNTPLALAQRMYYRVGGVKADPCNPAELPLKKVGSGPYVHSLSNLEDNRLRGVGVNYNNLADEMKLTVYPNPFTDKTFINYTLQKQSKVRIDIYNVVGELVKSVVNEYQTPGYHQQEVNSADVNFNPGLYYLKIYVDNDVIIRKTMLSK